MPEIGTWGTGQVLAQLPAIGVTSVAAQPHRHGLRPLDVLHSAADVHRLRRARRLPLAALLHATSKLTQRQDNYQARFPGRQFRRGTRANFFLGIAICRARFKFLEVFPTWMIRFSITRRVSY